MKIKINLWMLQKIWHTNWNVKCRWIVAASVCVCMCGGANLFSNWVKMQLTLPPGGNLWQLCASATCNSNRRCPFSHNMIYMQRLWEWPRFLPRGPSHALPIWQCFQFPIEDKQTDRQTLAQSRSVNLLNYKHGHFIRQRDKAKSNIESVQIQINSVHYVWRLHLRANLFGCLFSLKLSCPHHGHSIFFEKEVIEISNFICS